MVSFDVDSFFIRTDRTPRKNYFAHVDWKKQNVIIFFIIQLFQKMLSKEKQTSHKPRPQGSMGSFNRSSLLQLKGSLRNHDGDAEGKD